MNIGIDIGGSHIGVGLVGSSGKIINKKEQKYIHNSIFKSIPEYSNLFLIM